MAHLLMQMRHRMPPAAPVPKLIDPARLTPFVDPLPIPEIAVPATSRSVAGSSRRVPVYRLPMQEISAKVHRDLPPTRFWAFGSGVPGPTLNVRSGESFIVQWPNELPTRHFLPIDHHLMGAEKNKPAVRTVVHLHGGRVPPESDGYPENWYTPGKSASVHYPNEQESALLWYHDHTMGINRLNVYAGLMGLCIIRDAHEEALDLPAGKYEIPLVLLDRMLTADAQLYYPVSIRPEAPWTPEVFGNMVLANGKLLPFLNVEPRLYRLRILNGSNARFLRLKFASGPSMHQIGSDQGLMERPVESRVLTLAPGERADVLVDFSGGAGEEMVLLNDTVRILQFRVERAGESKNQSIHTIPQKIRPVPRIPESAAIRTRVLTLEELDDVLDEPDVHLLNGARWHDPVTEKPLLDSTEIWSLVNLTDDTHPIHLHLVRFQILDRRPFDVPRYLERKEIHYTGDTFPPEPGEMGWKDTVRATPAAVTRIIARFEGYTGRYVWHCHLLEHEDNEMMRPFEVLPAASS